MDSRQKNQQFYKNKKVLVTGHTGFKGAWLTCVLKFLEADAMGYALEAEDGSLYDLIKGYNVICSKNGDLRDFEHLKRVVADFKPEIIFHLGAFGFMNECFNNPLRAYSSNVMGTANLLEAIRECDAVKSVVIISSDKVYSNKGDGAVYLEEDELGGTSPYSCSKTCMELVVRDYYDTYFVKSEKRTGIAVARASNVLAGGDHIRTRLLPSILAAVEKGNNVELRNPNQTRPWQSIFDALDGYLTIGRYLYYEPEEYSGAWNIGPDKSGIKTVGWIFDKIQSYFNGLEQNTGNKFKVMESETLGLDISKSISKLDWKPRMSLDRVFEQIVDFYKETKNGKYAYELCMSQIKEYYGGYCDEMEQ